MLTYRTDDAARWGTGKGANLTPAEIDVNFWDLDQRVTAVETNPAEPNEIAGFTVIGSQLTVQMQDGTEHGPFTLPKAMIRYRGDWVATAAYAELDLVTVPDDGLYLVLRDHTAAAAFDPVATDADGNQLYRYLFPMATSAVEEAPADGVVYGRQDGGWVAVDVTFNWGDIPDVPAVVDAIPAAFGSAGQVLKVNGTADGLVWAADDSGGGGSGVSDEGAQVLAAPTDINFAGAGVSVADDGDGTVTVTVPGSASATPSVSEKAASYTFALADAGDFVDYNAAGAGTFTIPDDATVAFPVGTIIGGGQIGVGALTVAAAAGVTLNGVAAGFATLTDSTSEYSIRKRAANSWRLSGDHGGVA